MFATLVFAFLGCDNSESFNPDASADRGVEEGTFLPEQDALLDDDISLPDDEALVAMEAVGAAESEPVASATFAGGIPIGTFHQPNTVFGTRYNGALRVISAYYLLNDLKAIKARGGRIVLSLTGNDKYSTDARGHFSLSKWKARVDRFRGVNFNSYIQDGTIIGHFMMDEPNDPTNWNGRPVPPSTVEEMARYSKQLWPAMKTIIRAEPTYMAKWSGTYRYLDAAWAQYVSWKGTPQNYISRNVTDAQRKGLGLVVGLNIKRGGTNGRAMTPSQVKSWGTTMLSSSYPCAFISWEYNATLLSSRSMQSSMDALRNLARNRGTRSCS